MNQESFITNLLPVWILPNVSQEVEFGANFVVFICLFETTPLVIIFTFYWHRIITMQVTKDVLSIL